MASELDRWTYGVGQAARVGWYTAHYLLAQRLTVEAEGGRRRRSGGGKLWPVLRGDMLALFRRDWANVAAGLYAPPRDLFDNPLTAFGRSLRFFADLPAVNRRRRTGQVTEPRRLGSRRGLPAYYLQNFHFQSDGYLSRRSAELYDTQVEILFTGAANAMRRQALVPLAEAFAERSSRSARLLDLGCGTGRFLATVKENWPRLAVTGLDLSRPYLEKARQRLAGRSRLGLVQAAAEAVPLADCSIDVVTCIFLLHELPAAVRRRLAREVARLLRPGGRLVVVDSLQHGDQPAYDGLLDAFPRTFHEPYYADYIRSDLPLLFGAAGLRFRSATPAFLSKVVVFVRD